MYQVTLCICLYLCSMITLEHFEEISTALGMRMLSIKCEQKRWYVKNSKK